MMVPLLLYVAVALAVRYGEGFPMEEWEAWKLCYNKHYTSVEEEAGHRDIWMQHYTVFKDHMADEDRSFDMEMNEFSDQILPKPYMTSRQPLAGRNIGLQRQDSITFAPSSWDWRSKGAITPVKDQNQTGDGVTIAATECVESAYYIFAGTLFSLSTDEMHDCCTTQPTFSKTVFDCVHKIGGLCSMSSYPPAPTGFCKSGTCRSVALVKGGVQSPVGNETQLMESVYKQPVMVGIDASHASFQMYKAGVKGGVQSPVGNETQLMESVYKQPVMVGIDASHASFQMYKAGVYTEPSCRTDKPNHALQVVGYGSQDGQDYWICKNSWGVGWGMQGYILMARNKNNMCGIARNAVYPV